MRDKRTGNEEYFIAKFMDFFRAEIDENASEKPEITDSPDLAVSSKGRVIGVELSQLPSSYIIQNFHKKRPEPKYTKGRIAGHLVVYPFEPHSWVHEVLAKKSKKASLQKERINSDEMWLVMHSHSVTSDWPMSDSAKENSREAEAMLMRFGAKNSSNFDRVYYVYSDGTVVSLKGEGVDIPSTISLEKDEGYPAVTTHQFSFCFDVPLRGEVSSEYEFDKIEFAETIVEPNDDWMAGKRPNTDRPKFSVCAHVDSDSMSWKVFRDNVLIGSQRCGTSDHVGQIMYQHFLLELGLKKTSFIFHV
jgi:hypothetical protein